MALLMLGSRAGVMVSLPSLVAASLFGEWNLAHHTPLELVASLGVPLATAMAFCWMLVLALLIRAVRLRLRDGIVVPLAAFSVVLVGLLHRWWTSACIFQVTRSPHSQQQRYRTFRGE